MTERLGIILAVALLTYATRLAGFAIAGRALPLSVERFLAYVPVAAFAALLVPGVVTGDGETAPRLVASLAAAFAVRRLGTLWAGLSVGMAAYWAARALLGT